MSERERRPITLDDPVPPDPRENIAGAIRDMGDTFDPGACIGGVFDAYDIIGQDIVDLLTPTDTGAREALREILRASEPIGTMACSCGRHADKIEQIARDAISSMGASAQITVSTDMDGVELLDLIARGYVYEAAEKAKAMAARALTPEAPSQGGER
jgi:hypothetical protein